MLGSLLRESGGGPIWAGLLWSRPRPMRLFSDPFVEKIRELPNECKSFLGELCAPSADRLRDLIDNALSGLSPELSSEIGARMSSVDNRRFFQGFAELATAQTFASSGWDVRVGQSGHTALSISREGGASVDLMVMAFIQPSHPQLDPLQIERLRTALGRVRSDLRFSVFIRRWLPPNFDPEPIRRAVDLWLQEVESGRWEGDFATYEDVGVSMEFSLSGERAEPDQSPVVQLLGPFLTGRSVQRLEHTMVRRLDQHLLTSDSDTPLYLVAVANRPWSLSRGYLREFLYGKPAWTQTQSASEEGTGWEAGFTPEPEPCLFKDKLYSSVGGLLMLERNPLDPLKVTGRSYSNPFSPVALRPEQQPFPILGETRREGENIVLRWQ